MSDPTDPAALLDFIGDLRQNYLESSPLPTMQAAEQFDQMMQPLLIARGRELQREAAADMPSQAEMLMELVLEVEQVVSLVPPRLRRYRELLAAEGLDKTVMVPAPADQPGDPEEAAEGGREGLPGINLADQASLEFHSQLLSLSFAIAQDEVQQRMQRRSQQSGNQPA